MVSFDDGNPRAAARTA